MKHRAKPLICALVVFVLVLGLTTVSFAADTSSLVDLEGVDTTGAYLCIAILVVAFVLFFTEALPLAVTAMLVPIALSFPGIQILTGKQAFANFGEQWVVTFLAIFIVGEAVFMTGLANKLGDMVIKVAGDSQRRIILLMALLLGVVSAFLSNSATMALFAPVLIGVAKSSNLKPSQILMPMAFAICLGGNMTLMGASSKGVLNGLMETYGIQAFNFFDYTPIGVVLFAIGLIYFGLIGYKLLPAIDVAADTATGPQRELRSEKMPFAVGAFAVIVLTISTGWLAPPTAAMLGAMIVVISGCLNIKEAYRAVSWDTIFLFAGMLAMGDALVATGADLLIASWVLPFVSSPMMLLVIVYVLTMVITNFMSNTAAAAVATPIAISTALQYGVNPLPYCMAVGIAASLCFLTPVATPANTIAFGMGGYSFKDFFKIGFPLQVLMTISGIVFIPIFFPFS